MKRKKSWFTSTLIVLALLFFYLPIVYIIFFSFNQSRSLTTFTGFSLRWYEKMFSDPVMMESIFYTFLVAILSTVISTVVGTVTAIGLSRSRRSLQRVVEQVNDLPVMNPEIVTAIGLLMFFSALAIRKGLLTLLLAHIMFCTPYVMLSVMPKLRSLDQNLTEAAMDLGATPMQAIRKVIVPEIMPGIVSGALIAFTMSFDDFIISYFVTGNGVQNISILVYTMSKRVNPSINSLSTLIILMITLILIVMNLLSARDKKPTRHTPLRLKKIIFAVVAAILGISIIIAAVLGGNSKKQRQEDAIAKYGSDVLKLYICGEYLGENVISDFENMFGVKVIIEYFDSNEMMYTKLQGGDAYDVLVPSDYMIERLMAGDALQPLDLSMIPNRSLLAEEVKTLPFDPKNTYAMPYFWGSVGIVYDETKVDPADVESEGWEVLRDTKYRGDIYMYDSERDSFMTALKALGYSMNTDNMDELNEAYEWLLELNNTMEPVYVTDEVIDGMIGSTKGMAVVYSGDAAVILDENENMRFWMPEDGTNIWYDCMVIPANAENPKLANEFINYMLSYEAAYDNTETVGYSSVNAEVLEEMSTSEDLYAENDAYLPRTGYALDESFHDNPTIKKVLSEMWLKVKAAKP